MSTRRKQDLRTSQSSLSRPEGTNGVPIGSNLQNTQSSLAGPNVYTTQYTDKVFLEAVKKRPARKVNSLNAYTAGTGGQFTPSGNPITPPTPPVPEISYLTTETNNRLTTENNNNLIL
jgi:hypothetical protein